MPRSDDSPRRFSRRGVLAATASAVALVGVPARPAGAVTTVRVSDLGFDPADSTAYLQQAFDSTAETVIIDNVGMDWNSGPLFVRRSNITIVLEPGTALRAITSAFPHDTASASEKLLTIDGQSGITIVGYGARIVMDKSGFTTGEWRHALNLLSCDTVLIEGLTLDGSGGDGIYLGVSTDTSRPRHNTDVTLRNLVCVSHRRNALSVISVDGLLVEGCWFRNTGGTAPEAGVDLEPNRSNERLADIVFRDCVISGNKKRGVSVVYQNLSASSAPVSVLFDNVAMVDQPGGMPAFSVYGSGVSDPGGTIELRDCLIQKQTSTSCLGVFHKSPSGVDVVLNNVSMWDLGTAGSSYYDSIVLWAGKATGADPIDEYGGLNFNDCLLATDRYNPYLSVNEVVGGDGLAEVHGNLRVIGPGAASGAIVQDLGSSPHGVDHVVTTSTVVPSTTVAVAVAPAMITAGDTATITVTRTSSDLTAPLAVRLAFTGGAQQRVDFDGITGALTIPPGATSVSRTLTSRTAGTGPYSRTATIAIVAAPLYVAGSSVALTIDQP